MVAISTLPVDGHAAAQQRGRAVIVCQENAVVFVVFLLKGGSSQRVVPRVQQA